MCPAIGKLLQEHFKIVAMYKKRSCKLFSMTAFFAATHKNTLQVEKMQKTSLTILNK
jgi:hypothetical protein